MRGIKNPLSGYIYVPAVGGDVTITFFGGKWERVITFRYKLVNEARLLTRSRFLYNKTEQRKNFDQERLERNNKK